MSNGVPAHKVAPYMRLRDNIKVNEIKKYYGSENFIPIDIFWTPLHEDETGSKKAIILMLFYFFKSIKIILKNIGELKSTFILSRDPKILFAIVLLRKLFGKKLLPYKIVHVIPEVKKGKFSHWIYKNIDGFLASNKAVKDQCIQKFGISENKFELVNAPIPNYKQDVSKAEARKRINYSSEKPLIVYTGKLGKGVTEMDYHLEAAKALPHYNFLFSGGRKEVVDYFYEKCKSMGIENVTFPGFHNDSTYVRNYQLAADVLLSYYTSKDHNVENSFPQKLTEYMSTGNPVVTPDYPATREVLNEKNVFFVAPENAPSLIQGIKTAVENKELAHQKASLAREAVKQLTFDYRCKLFIDLLLHL
jgi:glycosyltransferase involved in cell wall biosynthesis